MPQPTPAGEDPKGPTPHANPRQGGNNRGPRPQQMPSHHHHHQHRQQARAGPPPPPVPGFGAPPPHFGAPLPILGAPPGFGALPPHLAAPQHGFAAPPGFAPQHFQQRQQQPIHIDPAILALQHQRLPLQAPFAPVPHPVSMNLRVGPAGANESVRVGGVPVQQSRNVGQPTPQLFGQPSVRVSGMPLPPPPPPQQAAPVEEAPLPQRSIKPDDALVQQFLERYEHQEEHEAITGAPVGFLDVDACLAVIEANDVTFVVTDTGTGKSSLVPKALMDIPGARIANSQPRRTAAVNLASRVSHLRNEEVGTEVGYWVRGERCGDINKCHLMYMTSYTLLLHLIDHHEDMNFTHIIIDEFHERQPDVEVMLGLLKLAVSTKRWKVKIILMSASVELELWKQYFDGLKVGEYSTCQPRYSIHDYYMEEVCRMIGAANTAQPFKDGTASSLQLKNSLFLVKEMLKFLAQHAEPKDSILVFLPGRTVVEEITQWVATNLATQLDPIPWYRDMELAKIQASLRRPATTRKKVYLATDIAEVSLTLPDVVFVVDSGFTKKPRIDPSKRNSVVFPPLEMIWCSRSSNRQRRGRVGRVQQGFFFTMTPESYLSELVDMEPQIANSTIHELSLHTLQVCRNPIGCFNLCRVKPKRVSLQHSMAILLDGGYALKNDHPFAASEGTEVEVSKLWNEFILGSEENKDLRGEMYVTTLKGRIAQRLPLNLESSTMVYYGVVFGLENLMILAAAITSCGTPFYTIPAENDRSQKLKAIKSTANVIKSYSFGLPSDVIAALGVTIAFKKQRCAGLSEDGEEHWCLENCVMRSRLGDILRLEDQIKDQLSAQIPFVDVKDPEDQETLLTRYAALVSLLAAGSHLERALFVENEPRTAQREKRVGPSIFLGLDALSDLFVASVCPWNVQSVVVPLSIQTKYGKLLGNFATQLQPKVFNVMLLLLAPQITYEIRDEEVLFEVELYHTKLCMRCDPLTGNDIIRTRQTMCAKMVIMRHQMMKQVSPTDESLDGVLAASGINLPQSVSKALDVSPFLRFIVDKINNTVATEFGRDVSPAPRATYRPQKWSILVSAGNGILTFVPPAPPVPTTTLDDGNATTTETFVEGDDE